MLMPLHKNGARPAAYSLMMHNRSIRYEKYFPPFLPKAHAPVKILTMKKITFIPKANILDCLPPHQHECAGNRFHRDRMIRQGLLVQMKIIKQTGPIFRKPIQSKGTNK